MYTTMRSSADHQSVYPFYKVYEVIEQKPEMCRNFCSRRLRLFTQGFYFTSGPAQKTCEGKFSHRNAGTVLV